MDGSSRDEKRASKEEAATPLILTVNRQLRGPLEVAD